MPRRRIWRIAHRGASGVAPEHTRAALLAALRCRADWIECDVRLTRDEQPVLWHDERLERTSDGRGFLRDSTLRQLRRLDCGGWFRPRFAGERLVTLTDALRWVRGQARLNIELKTDPMVPGRCIIARVLRCLRREGAAAEVLLSSFDVTLLAALRRAAPRIRRALIAAGRPRQALRDACAVDAAALHLHTAITTAARLRQAHARGLAVHIWTVDRPAQIRRCLAQGADGVVSNHPARVPRWWPA